MELPDDNPKTRFGVAKAPLHLVPPVAAIREAGVFRLGAEKYGPFNWRDRTVSASVYYSAALRHLAAWWDGEETDPESGEPHLAHVRACMAILLDAGTIGRLNDDRPAPGAAAEVIAATTRRPDRPLFAAVRAAGKAPCAACNGRGSRVVPDARGAEGDATVTPCPDCGGKGSR